MMDASPTSSENMVAIRSNPLATALRWSTYNTVFRTTSRGTAGLPTTAGNDTSGSDADFWPANAIF